MKATLNIIGAGHVGKTLGKLWQTHGVLDVQDILNRSDETARQAAAFIGSGRPVARYADLRPADLYLVSVPDRQIAGCCASVAEAGVLRTSDIVFHCSGALASTELKAAADCGAALASVHPVRSFALPDQVAQDFAGTFCGAEGDERALAILKSAFEAIGAQFVPLQPDLKIIYHAASVFACNYLATLLDVARNTYTKAGIAPDAAVPLMEKMVRETIDNIFSIGPANALTGPIARGDMETARRQCAALAMMDERYGSLYADFIALTAELAGRKDRP